MEIRRRLFVIGGAVSLWNKIALTVPQNMTTSGEIYDWLKSRLPTFDSFFVCMRDNAEISTWQDNDFIVTTWMNTESTSGIGMFRVRSPQLNGRYLQARNPVSNPTDTMFVYQDETFTVFYQ